MSKEIQRRRGTAAQHSSFTGAAGEITVNTDNNTIHVHDGVTAGGFETARKDEVLALSGGTLTGGLTGTTGTFTGAVSSTGGRTKVQANNETYSLQIEYGAGLGQYYIGATNSASPDLVFSNVGGAERFRVTDDGTVDVKVRAKGTVTTDNDLSFDMSASNFFKCTPTGTGTLTFTNITAGQSGNIWLDNSGGHVISAASTTYISAADLTKIATAGIYFLSYYSDGTNVMVSASSAVTSAGA